MSRPSPASPWQLSSTRRRAGAMSVLLVAEQGGWLGPISGLPFDEGLPQGTVGFYEAFGATS